MLRIAKYLKPFLGEIALVFVLLFAQALCDLNLPNYMSDIVNVGIQQNGIEHAAPQEISLKAMGFIQNLMTEEEKSEVDEAYTEMDGRYMLRRDANVPDTAFENASFVLIEVGRTMAERLGQGAGDGGVSADGRTLDMQQLYQFEPMLGMIPEDVKDSARRAISTSPEMMTKQYGIAFVHGYYRELGVDIATIQRGYILGIGWKMLLIALLGGIFTVLVGLLAARMSAGVAKALRRDVFAKVERFSSAEMNKFGVASLITRNTNDVNRVQMVVMMGTRMFLYAPIMVIGGVIMALEKSLSMSWILALAGVVLIGLVATLFSIAVPRFKRVQKLVDKLNLVSRENLTGLMVIRAFGTSKHEEERFDDVNRELTSVNLSVNRIMVLMMPVMSLIMTGTQLLTVWVGAHEVAQSTMQVGDMMAFMQYAMQIIMSFLMLSMMFVFAPQAAVSANRIADVLETEPSIRDPEQPKPFDKEKKGVVEFRDVCFRYEGAEEDALGHISFVAKPGETTAIIGSTGAGKTTIVNMIERFYDATSGQVMVEGVDVREVRQHELRAKIGFVPQKGVLISGTIQSNIAYGEPEAGDEVVRKAAEVAQALEFIEEKPDGFNDPIAQGGSNVSGGQKQRISIARALAKNPDIFIFDDSFSALDFQTDVALRKALKQHAKDSTVLIVAQRVSTILNAEQIIVLEEGRIVGRGTHRELLKSCPEYREIAQSQLSEEELA